MFRWSLGLLLSIIFVAPVYAHEFWISPVNYNLDVGQPIVADFLIGQDFSGSRQSFLRHRTVRHEIFHSEKSKKVSGRNGDRPAFQTDGLSDGLAILVHETSDNILKYNDYEKFKNFVDHKDFSGVLNAHETRGLPKTGFSESYRRYTKSLIAIGHGGGKDTVVGLDIEILALENPFTEDISGGMRVQVLMHGKPRSYVKVELFQKLKESDETVEITSYLTDINGIAIFPVKAGYQYMVDNVALIPLEPRKEGGPVWHSLWANLTFSVPKR
jgi:uncharacterized GH25 family protein